MVSGLRAETGFVAVERCRHSRQDERWPFLVGTEKRPGPGFPAPTHSPSLSCVPLDKSLPLSVCFSHLENGADDTALPQGYSLRSAGAMLSEGGCPGPFEGLAASPASTH